MAIESLAQRLRRLREKQGMSYAEVARMLDVRESTYREWEKGRKIQGEPYLKLAKIYGVSVTALLGAPDALTELEILDWLKKDLQILEAKIKNRNPNT